MTLPLVRTTNKCSEHVHGYWVADRLPLAGSLTERNLSKSRLGMVSPMECKCREGATRKTGTFNARGEDLRLSVDMIPLRQAGYTMER